MDEIGELSPYIQVKLLRVLQEREIERLGESRKRKINIRIITATHLDLQAAVASGAFREDLYYRLNVFPIRVPPLRERKDDIPLLVSHFMQAMNEKTGKHILDTSRQVMSIFMNYHWPGNVRELVNAIEHAFVLCNRDRIETEDLPENLRIPQAPQTKMRAVAGNLPTIAGKNLSKIALLNLLDDCGWNKAEVARRLGVSHTSVWKYMKKMNIPLQRR